MAPMDRPKRLLVRTALVSGSTVATLIGAQTLITVDQQAANTVTIAPQTAENTTVGQSVSLPTNNTEIIHSAPVITIIRAAPSITIRSQTGQANASAPVLHQQAAAQTVIQPPAPVQIAPPNPVIVQHPSSGGNSFAMPSVPSTHSSR